MEMTLRMNEALSEELQQVAEQEDRSMQQTAIQAIEIYIAQHRQRDRILVLAKEAAAQYPGTSRRRDE